MKTLLTTLLLLLIHSQAVAGEAGEALRAFFREVQSLRAEFSQQLLNRDNGTLQRSSGTVWLQRPGRFRWDYLEPYRQEIVADGERLWFYDTDLEQVTVKALEEGLGTTPAFLLTGDQALEERFAIIELEPLEGSGAKDATQRVELTPLQTEGNFERIRLSFSDGELSAMEIVDSFSQVTRIEFSDLRRNPSIEPERFRFVPPPGVDVLGGD